MAFYKFLMLKSLGKFRNIKIKPKGGAERGFLSTLRLLGISVTGPGRAGICFSTETKEGLSAVKKVLIFPFSLGETKCIYSRTFVRAIAHEWHLPHPKLDEYLID